MAEPSSVGTNENPGGRLYDGDKFSTLSSRMPVLLRRKFL